MSEAFFDKARVLDRVISAGVNNCDYARDLATALANDVLNDYFFQRLSDPSWLALLFAAGKFKSVPEAVEDKESGTIGFPPWPEGQYLRRVAPEFPELVAEIVGALPKTNNARVYASIVDIVHLMPPVFIAQITPKVIEAVRSEYQLGINLRVGGLIQRLSNAGFVTQALELASSVLEIVTDDNAYRNGDGTPFGNLLEPKSRIGLWEFEQIVTQSVPDLVSASGEKALDLLCTLLDRAIECSDRRGPSQRPFDYSQVWRPAIEDHQQNANMGVRQILVTAVRNASEQLVRDKSVSPGVLIAKLEFRGIDWWVFRRIGLHLLRIYSELEPELVRRRLTSRDLFDSVEVRHEYFLLEKKCFGNLSKEDQGLILGWIELGPRNIEELSARWEKITGKAESLVERTAYVENWKRDRLSPLAEFLQGEWLAAYQRLTSLGRSEHPEFTTYMTSGRWNPVSSHSRADIKQLSIRDLVALLNSLSKDGDVKRSSSNEGLARELTEVISENPEAYAAEACEFTKLSNPQFLLAVIYGFESALRMNRKFEWRELTDLCVWATQTVEPPGPAVTTEVWAQWRWTRTASIKLLTEAFTNEANPIPGTLRDKIWTVIESGTHDPEPSPEQETKLAAPQKKPDRNPNYFDPFTQAINSARGSAMVAVFSYGLWVRRLFEHSRDQTVSRGFDVMPEVRSVLEKHLDREVDPSISVRSIYGERSPWIQLMDEEWSRQNTNKIFPRSENLLWHAAWDTYIGSSIPYDKVFDWLREEYAFAIEQVGSHDHGWARREAPDYSLAQHLMAFCWRGKIEPDGSLIQAFYRRADAKLSGHALGFVGRSLNKTNETVSPEIITRLQKLWEVHLNIASNRSQNRNDDIKQFGWWFASGKFDDEWSISQLLTSLRLNPQVEPDHLVIEKLAVMASAMPRLCIDALAIILRGDTNGYALLGWEAKAREIIKAAKMSNDLAARDSAEDLINFLGERRFFSFGDLLGDHE